jgi:hypothetical protein
MEKNDIKTRDDYYKSLNHELNIDIINCEIKLLKELINTELDKLYGTTNYEFYQIPYAVRLDSFNVIMPLLTERYKAASFRFVELVDKNNNISGPRYMLINDKK